MDADDEFPGAVVQQAATWYARLTHESASDGDWDRYWQWRDADNRHAAAYDRLSKRARGLDAIADDPAIMELRMAALSVEPVRHKSRWGLIAAGLVAAFATSTLFLTQSHLLGEPQSQVAMPAPSPVPPAIPAASVPAPLESRTELADAAPFRSQYRTDLGERASFTLPDGSVIELNTASLVEVDFAGGTRNLNLVRGEALFRVAHDKKRPFVVNARDSRVTALGTVFTVRSEQGEAVVTLLEGRVRVDRVQAGVPTQSAQLRPGEELLTQPATSFQIRKANLDRAAGWRQGRLIFNNEPLPQVVEEINRYSREKLVIGDRQLNAIKVSGTFRIQSASRFAEALQSSFAVEVDRSAASGDLILIARREKVSSENKALEEAPKK